MPRRRRLPPLAAAFALALWVALLLVSACRGGETPEAKIRRALDAGMAALEARDVGRATAILADTYADSRGRTKRTLKQLAFVALQQGPVLVAAQTVDVKVAGRTAQVSLAVLAMQGAATLKTARDLLPTNARSFDLTLRMVEEDGEWRVAAIEGLTGGGWE